MRPQARQYHRQERAGVVSKLQRRARPQLAYEDAIRQLWPLMGFALRDKLAAA
jgi:hypothetical protein